jgi:hypothetical protein
LEAEILSFDTNSTCRAHSVLIVIGINPSSAPGSPDCCTSLNGAIGVQRRASASDGRSHSLFLTSAGEKALARIKSLAERHDAQTAEFVEPRRQMLLMGSLKDFGRRTVSPPLAAPQMS